MKKFFTRFRTQDGDPTGASWGNITSFYGLLIFLITIPFVLIVALVWLTGILGFSAWIFAGFAVLLAFAVYRAWRGWGRFKEKMAAQGGEFQDMVREATRNGKDVEISLLNGVLTLRYKGQNGWPGALPPVGRSCWPWQDTVGRLAHMPEIASPLMVCNVEHRFMIAEQMRQIGSKPHAIVLEPVGRNTAPAIAVAALMLSRDDPDALMLVLPADHLIGDVAAFHDVIRTAARAAQNGHLATFGIVAATPETGYGYIRKGAPLTDTAGAHQVAAFVEKPDQATAQQYVESGEYFWNSGMFLVRASDFLHELQALRPDILPSAPVAAPPRRARRGRSAAAPQSRT